MSNRLVRVTLAVLLAAPSGLYAQEAPADDSLNSLRQLVESFDSSLKAASNDLVAPQAPDSGTVEIIIQESMGMLDGFRVSSVGRSIASDATGKARLVLPVGRQRITVTRIGFRTAQVNADVVKDSVVTINVAVSMNEMSMELEPVKVSATRTDRLAGETPIHVEIIDQMEVDENTLMSPSGISMLLNETPGLRVQAAAPGLGTGSVRILGLPGQYTVMLADGLPLYGASASALGPLDISPVDLQRVEIIKGAASSLYGAQALGGVINLVAKPPTGKKEVLLNRRTLDVTDAATWLSERLGSNSGISLLASATLQGREDIDDDGWADQPRAQRWNVRPRFNAVDARGRSLFLTAGYGYDNRDGGTLKGAITPDGLPFSEGLESNRADIGGTGEIPFVGGGKIATRFAASTNHRRRVFGPGPTERDRTSAGFLEMTGSFVRDSMTTVVGAALQLEHFENELNPGFDRRWFTPGIFATTELPLGPLTISGSVRGDHHEDAGTQITERVAVLAKPVSGWSVRGSVGTGFAPSSPTTEETEAVGLRAVRANPNLRAEKSRAAMIDVNGQLSDVELLFTGYLSGVSNAIQLTDIPGTPGYVTLRNAAATTRIGGVEALGVWRFPAGKFIGSYGYAYGSRPDAATGVREVMPLLSRHRVGGDLMIERPGVYRIGLEGTWHGTQALDDNPYRSRSKPFVYVMAIAARQFGGLEAVANFENLLNVRMTDTHPLVRPTRTNSGSWTTDVWAPLEGFMANVALRYRWR